MFRKKTVAGILSQFNKMSNELRALAEEKHVEAELNDAAMIQFRTARNECLDEANLAEKKAAEIERIFG